VSGTGDAAARMDRLYRLQRLVYDPTRRFYLLGRDGLIEGLDVPEGGSVLEVACGTGRNLVRIGERYPRARLFGVDVSAEMLKSARAARRRAGLADRMALGVGDATVLDTEALFARTGGFDRVVFSYALSMIPHWRAAVDRGLERVSSGGSLHVVDFGDMARVPRPLRALQSFWLHRFGVTPRPEAVDYLREWARALNAELDVHELAGCYAWLARLRIASDA